MTPHAIAQRLVTRGFSVFPVPRPGPGFDGKTPIVAWKTYQTRRPTPAELAAWFATDMNIAIVTGTVSGVVVVDLDALEARQWWIQRRPYTPWQTLTSGDGCHLFYRHPGGAVANRARLDTPEGKLAIDVRGDGGYVIAPFSVHASGCTYRAVGNWAAPREQIPVFSCEWLARPPRPTRSTANALAAANGDVPHADPITRARAYLAAIPRPDIGRGSDLAVFLVACRLVQTSARTGAAFGLSAADAEDLLWAWAGGRPGWTREWMAQKVASVVHRGA